MKQGLDVPTVAAVAARGYAHDIMLTNLGTLGYQTDFGELQLEALWGPAFSARPQVDRPARQPGPRMRQLEQKTGGFCIIGVLNRAKNGQRVLEHEKSAITLNNHDTSHRKYKR
jgi:hypothetical protein